jgi:tetratricopeptide (TPR) repeat protein
MKSYTTSDVARLLGLSEQQVRSQARAGFLVPDRGPHNSFRFSFQDLILLRTARELSQARVAPRRIRRALLKLSRQLPAGRSLTELRICAEGERIVVRDDGTSWNPESDQLQIDFSVAELARQTAPIARKLAQSAQATDERLTAAEWFELGLDLEDAAPQEAQGAYSHALAIEPGMADAHVNLGRLLQMEGKAAEAAEHYRRAILIDGNDGTAAFNLGTAFEELGRSDEAREAYLYAIEVDPELADAHFNLSLLLEREGKRAAAMRHLRSYERLMK